MKKFLFFSPPTSACKIIFHRIISTSEILRGDLIYIIRKETKEEIGVTYKTVAQIKGIPRFLPAH